MSGINLTRSAVAVRPLFVITALVGVIGMLLGQLIDGLGWMTIVVPLVAMVTYVGLSWNSDRTLVYTASFADSIYFQGFLFTLVSLAMALWAFASSDGQVEMPKLVGAFATAILTTIVGLALRVYLVNFMPSAEESTIDAEQKLAESARHLKTHLDKLSVDVVARNQAFTEALTQNLESTDEALQEGIESFRASMQTMVQQAESEMRASVVAQQESMRTSAEHYREALARSQSDLERAIDDLKVPRATVVESLSGPLRALVEDLQAERSAVRELIDEQSKALAEVREITAGFVALKDAAGELGGAVATVDGAKNHLAALGEEMNGFRKTTAAYREALESAMRTATQSSGTYPEIRSQLEEELAALKSLRREIDAATTEANASLAHVQRTLTESVDYVRKSLEARA